MIPPDYAEKVYASILAMNAGIRLGAPVEPVEWTPETIQAVYGDIQGYVKDYTVFSADDDANGPIFFLRALIDYAKNRPLKPEDVANTWLNYIREGIGMIWWGGDQVSTEHTAYNNLRRGIAAPASGSIDINGQLLAEQIGGQIFIDSFALLFPNNPTKAADYAEIAASVSHDGEGLYGARFIAACIASAFTPKPMLEILLDGLREIPSESIYTKVVQAVMNFHAKYPTDFRACRQYLEEEWGYDKYGGICHIIPNAGVCVLSLLYGESNVSRSIEIATMCGWDTDCNAGNVGSIVGALNGLSGIAENYRKPINDCIVASSVSGYLNIVDLPTVAKQIALLGYRENQLPAPQWLMDSYKEEDIYFDFVLPGSTHGFKTSYPFKTFIRHAAEGYQTSGALEIFIDRMLRGDMTTVYYESFYRRSRFMDEKYAPTFSPTAYSGQTVSFYVKSEQTSGEPFIITSYIRTTSNGVMRYIGNPIVLTNEWVNVKFVIPDTDGDLIDQVGISIISNSKADNRAFGKILIDEFEIFGTPSYSIDMEKQCVEFRCVTPFAHHKGHWSLENGMLIITAETNAYSFTGHYYMKQAKVETVLTPMRGYNHQVIAHAEGIERFYSAGFENEQEVAIVLQYDGVRHILARATYDWSCEKTYTLSFEAKNGTLTLTINDVALLNVEHSLLTKGMVGMGTNSGGKCAYGYIKVNQI